MAKNRMMMLHLIIMLLLAAFLHPGFREEVKAAGAEDPITLSIDGVLCHQQAGELFDRINEERRNRGIQELIWDSGYESIAGIRAIETSVYFSHLLPSAEEELNIGVGKYNRSIVTECLTCHPESSSGYVEVFFSFKGNYKGTICITVAVPYPEQNGGTTPLSSDNPGHGGESSGSGGGNNHTGENSRLTVPSADSQNHETHETGASSPNQAGIRGNTKVTLNSKTATSTSSKISTGERADETVVRSDLKKPKLRTVKCSRKGILKISWKKDKKMLRKVDGYEVRISPDSRFESEVMTVSVKKKATGAKIKVKGRKRLYVRIRYFSSKGVSAWSKMKTVRIRK